jgi:uncharacterized protein (DUF2237 family)
MDKQYNVYGREIEACCFHPLTGFFRDGFCHTNFEDRGLHTVCIVATREFLEFSAEAGNDLTTEREEFMFPGVKPGDRWCLCAGRWFEAYQAGKAPPVMLESTHEETLAVIPLKILEQFAFKN